MRKIITTLTIAFFTLNLCAKSYLETGETLTNFEFQTMDGKNVSIDELKGKVVYINFFATWCGPCMKELDEIKESQLDRFNDKDFYFVALGRGHSEKSLEGFKEENGYDFNISSDREKRLFTRFSRKGIPLNVIIDREGKVIYKKTGYSSSSFKKMKKTIKRELRRRK
jgi:peroxiredoxin